MTNIIQMFPTAQRVKRELPKWAPGASPLELRWKIEAQAHTVNTYIELISSFSDPALSFIARTKAKEEQAKLDIMIAQYTGTHGVLTSHVGVTQRV